MSAQIDEVSSAFPGGGRIMVIGDTQRYVSIREHAKNIWRIPTGMTEFKAVSAVLRKKCQEGAKPPCVRRDVRWQLKKNRPETPPERVGIASGSTSISGCSSTSTSPH